MGVFASKPATLETKLEQEAIKTNNGYPPAYLEGNVPEGQAEFRYKDRTKPKDTGPKTLKSRYNKWESTMMSSYASSGGGGAGIS